MAKSDYWLTQDGLILLEGWARQGLTDEQIAHNMGIGYSTLKEWKNKFPAITDSLKKTKEIVDFEVENALYKNAMNGNTTAQIFWLKNRKPKYWRDKVEIETDNKELSKVEELLNKIKEESKNDNNG